MYPLKRQLIVYQSISYSYDHWPEKAMASHSSTLAWKIPWTEEPGGLRSIRSLRVGHYWATSLSLFTFMHWRRKWQPHSSVLAWRIPGTGEPGGLPAMGSHRVGHDWRDLAAAAAAWSLTQILRNSVSMLTFNDASSPSPKEIFVTYFAVLNVHQGYRWNKHLEILQGMHFWRS